MDSRRRSVAKALSWRMFATVITAAVAWAVTGKIGFAVTIGALDSLLKLGAYYAHERVWNRMSFGRAKAPEYEI